jgi:Ca2+-binding RTX toxin-like protein
MANFVGTAGNDDLIGTSSGDGFDLTQGGNDRAQGLEGIDSFNLGATYTKKDRIDGGADADLVDLSGAYAGTINLKGLTNVESVQVFGGNSYRFKCPDSVIPALGALTISASTLGAADSIVFDGSAETDGKFNFFGGAGNDRFTGGAGNDLFSIANGGNDFVFGGVGSDVIFCDNDLTALDRIDGGDGANFVNLTGDYSFGLVLDDNTIVNVSEIEFGAGHTYDLKTADANLAAGQTMGIDAFALLFADRLIFRGGDETDGRFDFIGGLGDDSMTGGAGDDTFRGDAGADILRGNGGQDLFLYPNANNSTGAGHDTINAFDASEDRIDVIPDITKVDDAVETGFLSTANFDIHLEAAIGNSELGRLHAVVFIPDAGGLAGRTFLIVDQNDSRGYDAGQDLVIELGAGPNLAGLDADTFI